MSENPEQNSQDPLTPEEIKAVMKEAMPAMASQLGQNMAQEMKDQWSKSLEEVAKEEEQKDRENRRSHSTPGTVAGSIRSEEPDETSEKETFSDILKAMLRGETNRTSGVLREMKQNPDHYADKSIERMERAEQKETVQKDGMQASQFDNAGVLLDDPVAEGIIELLEANTFIRQRVSTVDLPSGTLKLNKQNQRATAAYGDEVEDITPSEAKFGQLQLDAKKIRGSQVHSRDFVQFGGEVASQIIQRDLATAIAQESEKALLRDEGTEARPRGIRHWIDEDKTFEPEPVDDFANNFQNILATLVRQIRILLEHEVPVSFQNTTFAMNERTWESLTRTVDAGSGQAVFRSEMEAGRILGFEYDMSTGVPSNLSTSEIDGPVSELYTIWWPAFIMGVVPGLRVEASTEAAYMGADGQLKSAFSKDQAVFKAIEYHDLVGRYDFGASVTNVPSDWQG